MSASALHAAASWRKAAAHLREAVAQEAEASPMAVIHSSYYAMFHAAGAVLFQVAGDAPKRHDTVIQRFGLLARDLDEAMRAAGTRPRPMPMVWSASRLNRRPHRTMPNWSRRPASMAATEINIETGEWVPPAFRTPMVRDRGQGLPKAIRVRSRRIHSPLPEGNLPQGSESPSGNDASGKKETEARTESPC